MSRSRLFLLFLLPWFGCVDEVDFDSGKTDFPLVIEGIFSTDTARVRLSRGYPVNGGYNVTRIPGAIVWITDEDDPGFKLSLFEQRFNGANAPWRYLEFNGTTYLANAIVNPKPGHRYKLHVKVGSEEYESLTQLVREPGTVDSIYFTYTTGFSRKKNVEEDGFRLLFDATVPAGADRYFQWRMFGTFSVVADPMAGPERCWATEREDVPILSSRAHGASYAGMSGGYIPITFDRFNDRYRVEIRQYEVSRDVWEFTEALRFQLKNASSIFQPPFAVPQGNIFPLNGKGGVIGVFTASIDTRRVIYINRSDVPRKVYGEPVPANCLKVYPGSLAVRPPYWM